MLFDRDLVDNPLTISDGNSVTPVSMTTTAVVDMSITHALVAAVRPKERTFYMRSNSDSTFNPLKVEVPEFCVLEGTFDNNYIIYDEYSALSYTQATDTLINPTTMYAPNGGGIIYELSSMIN